MTSFNAIFKAVFGFYLAAFVVMRAYHFYHGFRHGLSTLEGDLKMGEVCRTDIVVKARTPDCAHWESVTRFEPFWTGCEHLWNNSYLLISISVSDAAKLAVDTFGMFVGYIVGVAILSLIVGALLFRLLTSIAPTSPKEIYVEGGEKIRYMLPQQQQQQQLSPTSRQRVLNQNRLLAVEN